jgi:hypothetical protein
VVRLSGVVGKRRRVISDNYSNHNLLPGAIVEHFASHDDGVDLYTQGGDGDEVAIDPRDLEDLPVGYRWATEDECERYARAGETALPDAITVPRTFDSSGKLYTQDEADLAVPLEVGF